MLEKDLVSSIMRYLKGIPQCFYWKEHGGKYGTAGIPDIICCIKGKFVGFEVKTASGVISKLQELSIRQIQQAGGQAFVVRSLEEVKIIINNLEVLHNEK